MENLTKEKLLKLKEFKICCLLDNKDVLAIEVLDKLNIYYLIEDLHKGTIFHKIFEHIYIKRSKIPKWKLATICNVSESTLFRIRRNIIECFKVCYDKFQRNTFKAN